MNKKYTIELSVEVVDDDFYASDRESEEETLERIENQFMSFLVEAHDAVEFSRMKISNVQINETYLSGEGWSEPSSADD